MKLADWLPALTGVLTLLANLVVTTLNIKNSRHLEREKKRWEIHAKNLERLVDLKEKLHTYETPEHFETSEIEWAFKQGRSRQEISDAIGRHLAAQAVGFNFALAEYKAHSHLLDKASRGVLSTLLAQSRALEIAIGPAAERQDDPQDESGIQAVDAILQARQRFINSFYELIDLGIDQHRDILK